VIDVYATPVFVRPAWYDHANCAGVAARVFFGERGESTAQARVMCAACQVRENCLDLALDRGELFGVWGGLTVRQRAAMRS
jgi:WhiB family redox-sensing transcriptional regulator